MIHWAKHPSGKLGTPQQPGGQPGGAKASVPMVKLIGHIKSSSNKPGMHETSNFLEALHGAVIWVQLSCWRRWAFWLIRLRQFRWSVAAWALAILIEAWTCQDFLRQLLDRLRWTNSHSINRKVEDGGSGHHINLTCRSCLGSLSQRRVFMFTLTFGILRSAMVAP